MLIFAKDIGERDHKHSRENENPELKEYMEYQRKLYPYTVIRAGIDLAYKELDDILCYIDNGNQKPEDSTRDEYPQDIPGWYKYRFPWTGSFVTMEDAHAILVRLIKAMDSFRTQEACNTYHWAVLYDSTHNIVNVYNELLKTDFNSARDIRLSNNIEVRFDDFINNYWPHLEFMILSQPDYSHVRLLERVHRIEDEIKESLGDGAAPLEVLEQAAANHGFAPATLPLLRRDAIDPQWVELVPQPMDGQGYAHLNELLPEGTACAGLPMIDAEYEMNFQLTQN